MSDLPLPFARPDLAQRRYTRPLATAAHQVADFSVTSPRSRRASAAGCPESSIKSLEISEVRNIQMSGTLNASRSQRTSPAPVASRRSQVPSIDFRRRRRVGAAGTDAQHRTAPLRLATAAGRSSSSNLSSPVMLLFLGSSLRHLRLARWRTGRKRSKHFRERIAERTVFFCTASNK